MQGDDLYLPTAPSKLVRGIRVDSGIPLQSAAKVPIMITFNVVDRDGDHNDVKPQACIFKVSLGMIFIQFVGFLGPHESYSTVISFIILIVFANTPKKKKSVMRSH